MLTQRPFALRHCCYERDGLGGTDSYALLTCSGKCRHKHPDCDQPINARCFNKGYSGECIDTFSFAFEIAYLQLLCL
jgi:hypothetical protein